MVQVDELLKFIDIMKFPLPRNDGGISESRTDQFLYTALRLRNTTFGFYSNARRLVYYQTALSD